MHRSKIDWTDLSWNPITGCKRDCPYCFARRQSLRFGGDVRLNLTDERCVGDHERGLYVLEKPYGTENNHAISFPFGFAPTFHRYRLKDPQERKCGQNIFVCSMADLFGPWIPTAWTAEIMDACRCAPQHNYLFLTKFPEVCSSLDDLALLPHEDNFWYGTTVTTNEEARRIWNLPIDTNRFISIEPLLEPVDLSGIIRRSNERPTFADWVIIGAETGRRVGKVVPERAWVRNIVEVCRASGIPVFMKESLRDLMGDEFVQEFPVGLTRKTISPRKKEILYSQCVFCKTEQPKKEMMALLSRAGRGQKVNTDGYVCKLCYCRLEAQARGSTPHLLPGVEAAE